MPINESVASLFQQIFVQMIPIENTAYVDVFFRKLFAKIFSNSNNDILHDPNDIFLKILQNFNDSEKVFSKFYTKFDAFQCNQCSNKLQPKMVLLHYIELDQMKKSGKSNVS